MTKNNFKMLFVYLVGATLSSCRKDVLFEILQETNNTDFSMHT